MNFLQVKDSRRKYKPKATDSVIFNQMNYGWDYDYDVYEKDIAVANFYFDKSTILQYSRTPRMTWTGFIGQIGGLLGLCLGISIVSFVELAYWFLYRLVIGLTATARADKTDVMDPRATRVCDCKCTNLRCK